MKTTESKIKLSKIRFLIFLNLALSILFIQMNLKLMAQDTIHPFGIRTPFELNDPSPANFPFQTPEIIGDINNDGFGDLVFNSYAADERTPDPMDGINKSLIITDIHNPDSCLVLYGSIIKGIQDYNGDGYDDLLDIKQKIIHFGSANGLSGDSLIIDYPHPLSYNTILYYAGDISNDGRSELFIGENNFLDTIYLYSGPDYSPIIMEFPYFRFDENNSIFTYYDYDQDGEKEFAISNYDYTDNKRKVNWYQFDTINNTLISENEISLDDLHDLSTHFPNCFADLNGDGYPDIATTYYSVEDQYCLEVHFGQAESPYFSNSFEIKVGNSTRLFYVAGDLNNDGADDWYSKSHADTAVIYCGNPNIAEQGFIKSYLYTGDNQFMHPLAKKPTYYLSINMPVFQYDNDSMADILMNFWTIDNNLRFDTIGIAIIRGSENLSFEDPIVFGRPAEKSFAEIQYGHRAKSLGDINKDGFDDWGTLALKGCYAEIFYGDNYLHTEPDIRILLPQIAKTECYDWASGDLNGDGWIDLAIANSSDLDVSYVSEIMGKLNRVFLFFGRPEWPAELNYQDADQVLEDTDYFAELGKNIGIVGDYNADGFDDLVVGGTKYSTSIKKAYLYYGGNSISPNPDLILSLNDGLGVFTFADPITVCGDINSDGFADFTLGYSENGRSLVYFGGPDADDQYDVSLTRPYAGRGGFGSVTTRKSGDYDADGIPDVVQCSYTPTSGIYIYKGKPNFGNSYNYTLTDSIVNFLGPYIEYVDDFTSKGKSDIYVNNYYTGNSCIFTDAETENSKAEYILTNNYRWTQGMASGDFDNDGYTEICTGNSMENNYGNPRGGVIQFYKSPILVAIEEPVNMEEMLVIPNPARDRVRLNFPFTTSDVIAVLIFDLRGKLVKRFEDVSCNESKQSTSLDISSLPSGVFIIRIQTAVTTYSQKLIVMK